MANLSKSKIIAFRQCPKRLWLEIHRPDLREDSSGTLASFRVGHQVGEIAMRIYDPEGKGVEINAQRDGFGSAISQSAELLAKHKKIIFEAGLKSGSLLAFADVMLPDYSGDQPGWRMVEVKSSTSVKDYHRDDVAVQSYIAEKAGVNLKSVALACIDTSWVYPGNGDYQGLLVETDLSDEAFSRSKEVGEWAAEAQQVAALKDEPDIATGDQCHTPFECGFCDHCNRGKPQPKHPLTWLPRFSKKLRGEMADQGIEEMRDVPDDRLNAKQQRVKQSTLSKKVWFDAEGAAADLAGYGFPAYFVDFETVAPAVPLWAGTRAYQQIPFQFSLHQLSNEGKLTHKSFLDLSGDDPSESFARALITDCGQTGPIFVYNAAFEASRIRDLMGKFPELSEPLQEILDRLVDLLPIARNRYYHPDQRGSWSIKVVLPSVAPDLSYDQLTGVADGSAAMEAYGEALRPETPKKRREEIRQQLETYCRLDTFAMVRLWQFFKGKQ